MGCNISHTNNVHILYDNIKQLSKLLHDAINHKYEIYISKKYDQCNPE